jgi:hypothetical protein
MKVRALTRRWVLWTVAVLSAAVLELAHQARATAPASAATPMPGVRER